MNDVAIAWLVGSLALALWLAVIAFVGTQMWRRSPGRPVVRLLWLFAFLQFPFVGVVAWLVWDGGLRDEVERRLPLSARIR